MIENTLIALCVPVALYVLYKLIQILIGMVYYLKKNL